MNKFLYVALICLVVTSTYFGVSLERTLGTKYPEDMRFYMYCEECSECGYKEKEVEYSKIVNVGMSHCPQCQSTYNFKLSNKGEKIFLEGDNYEN